MYFNDDFMSFAGFRESQIDNTINECVSAFKSGADSVTIDRSDLADSEISRVRDEVSRRLGD